MATASISDRREFTIAQGRLEPLIRGNWIVDASGRADYAASWYSDTAVSMPRRAPLAADIDVDVCVVGAGLAGLTTARELARRGWSVAVLEARRVAWNASGRNTGFVLPGFAESMDVVVRRVGLDHARALWAWSVAGLDYVRATIQENALPGVAPVAGWLKVSKTDDADADLALVRLIGQDLGGEVEGWPVDRVREVLRSRSYFHAISYPSAFHIHALNYALGLAEAAEAAGARIYEETLVTAIDVEGVRKRLTTSSARIRASHIVLAGNVHLGRVMPRVAGTLLPVWTYVATTQRLGMRLNEAIAYHGAITDTDRADNHYRIVGGDRLMWAGGLTTWEGKPRHFARRLQQDIERIYPQLGEVEFEHIWTGVLGNALHRMPQIGELSPHVWLASGFGGHGINTTAMAGMIIARAIADGDDSWRLFLPFELVWAGGRIGQAVAQIQYWWHRQRELRGARESREREEEYHRAAESAAPRLSVQASTAQRAVDAPPEYGYVTQQDAPATLQKVSVIAPEAEYADSLPPQPSAPDITDVPVPDPPEAVDERDATGPERIARSRSH